MPTINFSPDVLDRADSFRMSKAVPKKGVMNAAAFGRRDAGKPDPLYRTWWFFTKAVGKDGATDTALQSQIEHVQLMFSDGEDSFMDRMPRMSARVPCVKFLTSQPPQSWEDGQAFASVEKTEELPGIPYVVEIATGGVDPTATPWGPAAPTNATGSLTFNPAEPVPKSRSYWHHQAPTNTATATAEPAKLSAAAKAKLEREHKLQDIVCTVDAAGSTTAKCKVTFVLKRGPKENSLDITHPNGTVYSFSTKDPTPQPAKAKATPASPASGAAAASSVPQSGMQQAQSNNVFYPQAQAQAQAQPQQQVAVHKITQKPKA